ncbi:MAG: S1-C subfamily serine protease [Verrucomicrobiales bacterium]
MCGLWLDAGLAQGNDVVMKRWQSNSRSMALWVFLFGFLNGGLNAWAQQGFVKSEKRNQLKKSTIYIKTKNGEGRGVGSGFVVKIEGEDVYIATNHHVIDAEREGEEVDEKRTRLSVVFSGEDPTATPIKAELLAADFEHDLAILRVKRKDSPAAFELFSKQTVEETLPVTVFGFPLGDPSITINNAQVSSFMHDSLGGMRRVKIFGKVDPGNSGGPVVDNEGALIGVTVEKDRRAEDIGYAIPAFELHEMLRGRLGNFTVKQEGGPDTYNVKFSADVLDPYDKLKKVMLHYATEADVSESDLKAAVTENGAKWALLSTKMKKVPVSLREDKASMSFEMSGEGGKPGYLQLSYQRDGEPDGVSRPIKIVLGDHKHIVPGKYRGEPEEDDPDNPKKKPKKDKSLGKYPLPSEPKESIAGKRIPLNGYRASEWNIDAKTIIPNVMWDENSLFVYMVTTEGLVRKVDPFRNQVDVALDLKVSVKWAVMSGEGLLILTKDDQLWIVDDRDLKVRRVIEKIPGLIHVASSRAAFYAYCVTGEGSTLEMYDLVDGEKTQTYQASDFELPDGSADGASSVKRFDKLTMTPEGRYLLCESDEAMHRFVVEDDELTYAQASGKLARTPERIDVSEDGLYVSLIDRDGNRKQGEVPIKPFGIYVFDVSDLAKPMMAVDGGQPTPFVVREDSSRSIFGTVKNAPLVRFDLEGTKVREFPELEGEFASQIVVYPKRPGFLLVLTDVKIYVLKQL